MASLCEQNKSLRPCSLYHSSVGALKGRYGLQMSPCAASAGSHRRAGTLWEPPPNPLGRYDRGVRNQSNLVVEGLKDVRGTRTTRGVLLFSIVLN